MFILRGFVGALFDLPFKAIRNQIGDPASAQLIPAVVHQTWEANSFGRRHRHSISHFRQVNPELSFVLYDKNQRDDYMLQNWKHRLIHEIYTRSIYGTLKADIFRYCVVHDLGGYYFDISKGTKSSITAMHAADDVGLISFENNKIAGSPAQMKILRPSNLIIQWGFGFVAGHEILLRQIERMERSYPEFLGKTFSSPKAAILDFSGPISFTKTVHEFAKDKGLEKISQKDVDFAGQGIYSLWGSGARFLKFPSYANAKDTAIFI